ncbi:MAG: hypothetical protein LQ350_008113 [Teloschistes chrysophthalmus]|nr:MAG: hypothetical protein LQ350_008113 [Niorma chrysophthalma]
MSLEEFAKSTTSRDSTQDGEQRQQEMLAACSAGNLEKLQQLLSAAGAKAGDDPVEGKWLSYPSQFDPVPSSGPAATSVLLAHAVIGARPNTLAYLLATYPTSSVKSVLWGAFEHPDLATFKLLYRRDPSIVNHEFESGETALMVACLEGAPNPLLPTFLLENGADPNRSGLGLTGPLVYAVEYKQPLSLIRMMVEVGASVKTVYIHVAIRHRRFDVAQFFLDRCRIDDEQDLEKHLREHMLEIGHEEVRKAFDRRVRLSKSRGLKLTSGYFKGWRGVSKMMLGYPHE